jgi:hypothetical protein
MITNAPSYKDLQAYASNGDVPSLISGGSFSGGLAIGYDYNYIPTDTDMYSGHTFSIGVGAGVPIPAEIHSLVSYTGTDEILIKAGD